MSSEDSVGTSPLVTPSDRLVGRVKWFNNKAGYGFVTVTDGVQSGSDIFAHHSVIGVSNQQYKYLVQGEYVEFSITPTQGGAHAFQASCICGIKGGKLMCETRNEFKIARNNYKTTDTQPQPQSEPSTEVKMPRQKRAPKSNDVEQKDWTLSKGNKPSAPVAPVTQPVATGARGTNSGRGRGRPRATQGPK